MRPALVVMAWLAGCSGGPTTTPRDAGEPDLAPQCVPGKPAYFSYAKTADGPCMLCRAAEPISLVARITNPCDQDLHLTTSTPCLVYLWKVENLDRQIEGGAAECIGGATDHVVAAHDSIEEGASLSVLMQGFVYPGRHRQTITFDGAGGTTIMSEFDLVQ